RDTERHAGLAHQGLRLLQGEVRFRGAPDEGHQELVVEGGPPGRRGAVDDGVAAPLRRRHRCELTPGRWCGDVRPSVVGPHHASYRTEHDDEEEGRASRHGFAAPGAELAGFGISTRLPSAMFADIPV